MSKISFKFPRVPLDPGKFEWNFTKLMFMLISDIDPWGIASEISLK